MGGTEVWAGPLHSWGDIDGKRRGSSGVQAGFAFPFHRSCLSSQDLGSLHGSGETWIPSPSGCWEDELGYRARSARTGRTPKHSSGSCPVAVGSDPEARERTSLPTSLLRPYPHAWHSSLRPSGSPCLNADFIWDCLMAFIQVISTLTLIR